MQRDRQKCRHTDGEADRQTETRTVRNEMLTDRNADRHREIDRNADTQIVMQTDREASRQTSVKDTGRQ